MKAGSKISCMGIIGDGCGGGREFIIENEVLYAYDELTDESIVLLEGVKEALEISKSACILFIVCKDREFEFDLSTLSAS